MLASSRAGQLGPGCGWGGLAKVKPGDKLPCNGKKKFRYDFNEKGGGILYSSTRVCSVMKAISR